MKKKIIGYIKKTASKLHKKAYNSKLNNRYAEYKKKRDVRQMRRLGLNPKSYANFKKVEKEQKRRMRKAVVGAGAVGLGAGYVIHRKRRKKK